MRMLNNATPSRGKTPDCKILASTGLVAAEIDQAATSQDMNPYITNPRPLVHSAEALLNKGDVYFEARDWKVAAEYYGEAVALEPDHFEATALLVDALYRRAQARPDILAYREETLAACEEALLRDPDCSAAAHFLARTLQDLGRQEEAYRRHEKTALQQLTCSLQLLTEAVAAKEPPGDLSFKILLLDALLNHVVRLFSAYGQERQGEPIKWEDLSDPISD